jgi:diguanylate cyclase (GGDEF)-like protein
MTTAESAHAVALTHGRRSWTTAIASAALLILLGTLAAAVVLSHKQSRSQIQSSFGLRGVASARFVSTYVDGQANRQRDVARRSFAAPRVSTDHFQLIVGALGSGAATLFAADGHVLEAIPSHAARPRASGSARSNAVVPAAHTGPTGPPPGSSPPPVISGAEQVAISGVHVAPNGDVATAIAVAYSSAAGRRILSVDYPASALGLQALAEHAISYPQHNVYIVDSAGRLVAASPITPARTLAAADPQLASAIASSSRGSVPGAHLASTFTVAPVPGTSWRMVIAVPDGRLYASIAGWTLLVPWLVLGLVSVLGALLVALFARSMSDRARLTKLSAAMRRTAQTDSLTGLYNRRALTEQLTRASARARRHGEPLSVLMIDLDRFKQTNDTFGHEAGDQVLCTIADCMRDALRIDDIYGRWGGDEFLVALPVTDNAGARVSAERLREAAAAVDLASIGLPAGVALSVGVATGVHTTPIELIRHADLALYRAKAVGHEVDALASRM